MKSFLFLIILISIFSCKPSPTYNPFDNKFDISIKEVIKDNCDTIVVGCGYFNLQQKEGELRSFYLIYIEDWNNVEAKGFSYIIDTLNVTGIKNFGKLSFIKIPNEKIELFNSNLSKYNYEYFNKKKGNKKYFKLIEKDLKDTLNIEILWDWIKVEDSTVVRTFEFWRAKP